MSRMNMPENVKAQYQSENGLSTRMNLHAKHSTNRQGFFPWLFEKYAFFEGFRILELGCGNAAQWENRMDRLPPNCILTLSDFSDGMVKTAWGKYKSIKNVLALRIDIQNIPFPDECFDVIIANHMLYHVPDLHQALFEVHRVLRAGGKFYSSTNGNGGMHTFLRGVRRIINPDTRELFNGFSFSLQNGKEVLMEHFADVQRYDFEDSLRITETRDLIDWMKSTMTISDCSDDDYCALYNYFEEIRTKKGAIDIPKEVGLFVSTK